MSCRRVDLVDRHREDVGHEALVDERADGSADRHGRTFERLHVGFEIHFLLAENRAELLLQAHTKPCLPSDSRKPYSALQRKHSAKAIQTPCPPTTIREEP